MGVASTFRTILNRFRRDESGAVTVDYVVLSAAIVGLGVSGVGFVQNVASNLAFVLSEGVSTPMEEEE